MLGVGPDVCSSAHCNIRRYYRFLSALEAAVPVGSERGGVPLRFKASVDT